MHAWRDCNIYTVIIVQCTQTAGVNYMHKQVGVCHVYYARNQVKSLKTKRGGGAIQERRKHVSIGQVPML